MKTQFMAILENLPKNYISVIGFIFSIFLIIISCLYLTGASILNELKKRKILDLFKLDPSLQKEMDTFKKQHTKLVFHFIYPLKRNKIYKYMYLVSLKTGYKINGKDLTINYVDEIYPYKYNVTEEIKLVDNNKKDKSFLITVNKYIENHYNIKLEVIEDKKAYSLETIIYSKIKDCLKNIDNLIENIKIYKKENYIQNMIRFNIINGTINDLINIYIIDMENEERCTIKEEFFKNYDTNLLLNIIISNDKKVTFRRIFKNKKEKEILKFDNKEIELLKKLYSKIIKKYIHGDLRFTKNTKNFINDFTKFDKENGYSTELDKNTKEIHIFSDLRLIIPKIS